MFQFRLILHICGRIKQITKLDSWSSGFSWMAGFLSGHKLCLLPSCGEQAVRPFQCHSIISAFPTLRQDLNEWGLRAVGLGGEKLCKPYEVIILGIPLCAWVTLATVTLQGKKEDGWDSSQKGGTMANLVMWGCRFKNGFTQTNQHWDFLYSFQVFQVWQRAWYCKTWKIQSATLPSSCGSSTDTFIGDY